MDLGCCRDKLSQWENFMGDDYNFEELKREILARSRATDWELAKKEWRLVAISEADEPERCLCSHFPIIELCSIRRNR